MKAESTVLAAHTVAPNATTNILVHTTSYTSPHAPDTKNIPGTSHLAALTAPLLG